MFRENKKFEQDISMWDTRRVETMERMFEQSGFHGDVSNWRLDALTEATGMFDNPRLANMVPVHFYHWYSLLEDEDALAGHPDEKLMVAHAQAHYHVLAGLGMGPLQIAQQLQTLWNARFAPAGEVFSLPVFER